MSAEIDLLAGPMDEAQDDLRLATDALTDDGSSWEPVAGLVDPFRAVGGGALSTGG